MDIRYKKLYMNKYSFQNVINKILFQSPEESDYSDDVNGGKLNNDDATLTDEKRPTIDLRHKGSSHAHNVSVQKNLRHNCF